MPGEAKGAKKGKGKKESDREKDAEELKIRQQQEEQLRAETQRREKEERAKKEREATIQLFESSKDALTDEATQFGTLIRNKDEELSTILFRRNEELEWKKFLECRSLPQPNIERDVNTYISTWSQEQVISEKHTLELFWAHLDDAEDMCDALLRELSIAQDHDHGRLVTRYQDQIYEMRHHINIKWNEVVGDILQFNDHFPREVNENFQTEQRHGPTTFGVWGNMTKNPRYKSVEFDHGSLSFTVPKPIMLANLAVRIIEQRSLSAIFAFPNDTRIVAGRWSPLGGVLSLDLYDMPDPPRRINMWTIRTGLPAGGIPPVQYPFKKNDLDAVEGENEGEQTGSTMWPVPVTWRISSNTFLHRESVSVLFWDESSKSWSKEGISEFEIEADIAKFRTIHFKPTILVQDAFAEFPISYWEVVPGNDDTATLIVRGKLNELEFSVSSAGCKLVRPALPSIENQWLSPSMLLQHMAYFGYNFARPNNLDQIGPEILKIKNPICENAINEGMGLTALAYRFRHYPGNTLLGMHQGLVEFQQKQCQEPTTEDDMELDLDGNLVVKAKEDNPPDNIWRLFCFDVNYPVGDTTFQVAYEANSLDPNSTETAVRLKQGSNPHFNMYMALYKAATPGARQVIDKTPALLSRNLHQLLNKLHLLSSA